jgi:hypothetical protein
MLFLALSGLLLVGILGGLGGNIARQRYNDAVQDTVNMLRDQYSFVTDTEISIRYNKNDASCYGLTSSDTDFDAASGPGNYFKAQSTLTADSVSWRGRTNCVVYGAVININNNYMETTELIGRDYMAVLRANDEKLDASMSDLEILKNIASANNMFYHCDDAFEHCYVRAADSSRIQSAKWGTKYVNIDGTELHKTLLIFRSPRDGSIRTYVWNDAIKNGDEYIKYDDINKRNDGQGEEATASTIINTHGINQYLDSTHFKIQDLDICVDSGDSQTYNNARRLVKVQRGGMGQNAVELINLDLAKDASDGSSFEDGEYRCN